MASVKNLLWLPALLLWLTAAAADRLPALAGKAAELPALEELLLTGTGRQYRFFTAPVPADRLAEFSLLAAVPGGAPATAEAETLLRTGGTLILFGRIPRYHFEPEEPDTTPEPPDYPECRGSCTAVGGGRIFRFPFLPSQLHRERKTPAGEVKYQVCRRFLRELLTGAAPETRRFFPPLGPRLPRPSPSAVPVISPPVPWPDSPVPAADARETALIYYASAEAKPAAEELLWHLKKITGREFQLSGTPPAPEQTAIICGHAAADPPAPGTAAVRKCGRQLLLSGDADGLNLALTLLLEHWGCRFLQPGPAGKIIPKKFPLFLPEVALVLKPAIPLLILRPCDFHRGRKLRGLSPEELSAACRQAAAMPDGTRDFHRWHGLQTTSGDYLDRRSLFQDWYERHGRQHPDYFAAGPDGFRAAGKGAPLCLSHPELPAAAAAAALERFAANPACRGTDITPPARRDFGSCLCRRCRLLDPADFPLCTRRYPAGTVSTAADTHRIFRFANAAAALVQADAPDKKLLLRMDITSPPPLIPPHPALIILFYSSGEQVPAERVARWLALCPRRAWAQPGPEPEASPAPLSRAGRFYRQLQTAAAAGLPWAEWNGNGNRFGARLWESYALIQAMRGCRLSYEELLTDFCRCFGPAAPLIGKYCRLLEHWSLPDAAGKVPIRTPEQAAALVSLLTEAENCCAGTPVAEMLVRMRLAAELGELETLANDRRNDAKIRKRAQKMLNQKLREALQSCPEAMAP